MTYRECLASAAARLTAAGVPEAALDAWYLLSEVTGWKRAAYFLHQGDEAPEAQEAAFRRLIAQREKRVPLQHILGVTEFMGFSFQVNPHVLIPRQDTEKLVELVLAEGFGPECRLLDLCTGSGCIAISLAKLGHFAQVTAADIAPQALAVARENGERLACENVDFVESDLFAALSGEIFDVIVANPPYIPSGELAGLMPEVRDHDPRLALDGGADGLYFYRRLAVECPSHLAPHGRVFFEIGCEQAEAVRGLLEAAGFCRIRVFADDAGRDRVITGEYKNV